MSNLNNIIELAKRDLSKAQANHQRLSNNLTQLQQEITRLTHFLQQAEFYQSRSESVESDTTSRGSRTRDIVDFVVRILGEKGKPAEIQELLELVEKAGFVVSGGDKQRSYLAAYLSRDDRIIHTRGAGWELRNLDVAQRAFEENVVRDNSENTAWSNDEQVVARDPLVMQSQPRNALDVELDELERALRSSHPQMR